MKQRSLIIIAGIIISVFTVSFLVLRTGKKESIGPGNVLGETKEVLVQKMTPTPFPFAEMTIPFLRSRAYDSQLGELIQAYKGQGYTAYTTHFISDGLRINALMAKPHGPQPVSGWPAVVFVHGYIPPKQYDTLGPQYKDYVDYLARNGLVVLKIDLRGHGNSEGEAGGGYFGSDYVVDTLSAYNALSALDGVNARAIGLWGHSMAGNIVLRAAAAKPAIPAVVIWSGAVYTYTDMAAYRIRDASYVPPPSGAPSAGRRRELMEKMGTPSAQSLFWQQVAPTTYLSDLTGAIAVYHAEDDPVVSIDYTRNLKRLLDQTNVVHEIIEYPSGGHNLSGASFAQAMDRTVTFYQTHLPH